jgi:dipeptidyl aminopeptidase/acylaminoacyl peptidase
VVRTSWSRRICLGCSLAAALFSGPATDAGPAARALRPEDLFALRNVTAVEVSPAGGQAVFVVEWADAGENEFTSDLYLVPTGPGAPADLGDRPGAPAATQAGQLPEARRLTHSPAADTSPRWSPDGQRLAFLSERDGQEQIYVLDLRGGEPARVTESPEGVEEFDWSPDGARLVYVTLEPKAKKAAARGGEEAAARDNEGDEDDLEPIVITRTQIKRDGEGYLDDRHTHLWVVPARGGEARRLTGGSAEQARWDDEHPRWSPDGKWIVFVSNRAEDPDASDNTDLWLISPEGGEPRRVTGNPGSDEAPSWSPDGKRLAWVANLHPNNGYTLDNLMVMDVSASEPRNLSGRLDRWVATRSVINGGGRTSALWSADGRTLYVTTEFEGRHRLTAFPVDGGEPRDLVQGPFTVDYPGLDARANRFVFALTDPVRPYDLYTSDGGGGELRRLTALNDEVLAGLRLSRPEVFTARNSARQPIESWLYPPVDPAPGRKVPLILYIHGGPQGFDGDYFDPGLENQLFPGQGWAVLRVNYRGSSSYGEKFSTVLFGDWHSREHEDLMAALDEALRKYPYLDESRLGIGGWSYGGIMTIWTVGRTDRFKVGVPERFEVDYPGLYGVDQWHIQYETEFGSPFRNRAKYWQYSPLRTIEKIRTPLFLISDALDANCPLPQAEMFYQGLKYLKIPTELVIYPGEPHSMLYPSHLVDRLRRLVAWYRRYLDAAP